MWLLFGVVASIIGLAALLLAGGTLIPFVQKWLGSEPATYAEYCSRPCAPGEFLISSGSCIDCVNILTGSQSSITVANTLACSDSGVCLVTKGSGTNLTIAALAASGLVTLSQTGGVVTVSASVPTGTLPLCGSCPASSSLRIDATGTCYECYTFAQSGLATVSSVGSVTTIGAALPAGTLALCGSCPAQATLKIATNGSCYECYTPTLACVAGDVCGVQDGSGGEQALYGYTAAPGVTIANVANATTWGLDLGGTGNTIRTSGSTVVIEQDLGDTSGDVHKIWRNADPLTYTSPWMYADTVQSLGGTGPTQVVTLVMARTWADTTVDVSTANLSNVTPRGASWNNSLVLQVHYNFAITYDGTTPSVNTLDFTPFVPAGVVTTNVQGTGSCMDIINPPLTGTGSGVLYAGPLNQVIAVVGVGNGGSYSSYVVCQMTAVMLLNSTAPTSYPWDGHLPA